MHLYVYIYLYTFYRIFIWVLYLLGREKECVYVYTFCRCIRVIVCFPIIMLWTNLRFRHIANALSQEVFQELVSFCVPMRETNTLYDTICVWTWSLQTWPRLGQSQTSCGCSFHCIFWPWVKHCSVEVCLVTWDYRGCIILQNLPGCAVRVSQHKRLADDGILCTVQFLVMTQRGQSVLKDFQFKIFLLSVSFPWT